MAFKLNKKVLHHYTSVAGFEGIIKSNSIRMTRFEFLNDPNDCVLLTELIKKHPDSKLSLDYIKEVLKDKTEEEIKEVFKICESHKPIPFFEFVQSKIGLYVISFTEEDDAMPMWNYYGSGGVELEFVKDDLIETLQSKLVTETEYLLALPVIYTNSESELSQIKIPCFDELKLANNCSKNIFEEHQKSSKTDSNRPDKLYQTKELKVFIDTYLKSFVISVHHLYDKGKITSEENKDTFEKIFENISKISESRQDMVWKSDLLLYMLVLSALIKSDTYEYEKEHRIVYFENNIGEPKQKKEEYNIKNIGSNQFLYSFISFDFQGDKQKSFNKSLTKITLSPMTHNLSINPDSYKKTIQKFLETNKFDIKKDNIVYSKHKIRW